MTSPSDPDPYELRRFVDAPIHLYPQVIQELSTGRKRSHWMWFVLASGGTVRVLSPHSGAQPCRGRDFGPSAHDCT
jgi:uncharacterized protein (DUF1810 family)